MLDRTNPIKKGRILVYRVFDIGEEINLEKAEQILFESTTSRSKFRLNKINRQAVIVSNDPLSIILGQHTFEIGDKKLSFEISAKLWEFGTLSITFEFSIPDGSTIDELRKLSGIIQDYDNLNLYARSRAIELCQQIHNAIGKINEINDSAVNEDFILFFIEKFERDYDDASVILSYEDIAGLILNEEKNTLSPQIYERIYESKLQYYRTDLAVIDWNSALVIEPSGSLDIPDVIEFALSQLLEMRYYDDLLDKKLREVYSAIELKEINIFSARYTDLALKASQRYIEIAEVVESVENSLKVIGDLYHSVVFRMASKKFRFSDWRSSIDNKLDNLADVFKLLLDNINHRRSQLLELTIIVLISLELIPIFHDLQKLFR